MNTEPPHPGPAIDTDEAGADPSAASPRRGVPAQAWRATMFVWKSLLGAVFTQSILGGLIVLGWGMRVMQRSALKCWWKQSPARQKGVAFPDWLRQQNPVHDHAHWPNWVLRQANVKRAKERDPGSAAAVLSPEKQPGLFSSLWRNLKQGVAGTFNIWVLTLPGCALMLFSWYDGWNNSFNKGYEQAPVGPLLGIFGILLFIAAMLYVPMAHARQAATGQWRSFYQFRLVWQLARRCRTSCLMLALGFSLVSLPVTIMKTAPYFLAMGDSPIPAFSAEEARQFLSRYFLGCGLVFFAGWLALRCWTGRVYARALLQGLQQGSVAVTELGPWERRELSRLHLIQIHPPRSRHVLVQVAAKTGTGLWRFAMVAATLLVWFTFVAQVYVAEFLMYHPVQGWLNQPLVQLPWFRYIPPHLQDNAYAELLLTALGLGLVFGGAALARRWRSFLRATRLRREAMAQRQCLAGTGQP